MATLLSGFGTTGLSNVKGYRTRDSDMAVWSTVAVAFVAFDVGDIADYGIAATEQGATGLYSFTDPADTTPGRFLLIAAAGASLAVSDVATNTFWEESAGGTRVSTGGIVAASFAAGAIDAAAVAAAGANKIADHVRRRTQANVEASSDGDAISLGSEYGVIQQIQKSVGAGGTLSVYETDGATLLGTKTLASDPDAEPVTGIS